MRLILKICGWVFGAFVLLIAAGAVTVYVASNSKVREKYTVAVKAAPVPSDAAALLRGKHIATTRGCLECHGSDGGGAKVVDDPAMGKLYGPNITRGNGGLAASFANEDWVRAIRHGIGGDGRTLVLMPSMEYSEMSDDDFGALLAYLQSLPKVDRATVPIQLGPVSRALIAAGTMPLAAAVIDHAKVTPSKVPVGVTPAYGRYLAVGCIGCHNPAFSGGKIDIGPPDWPHASNLTPGAGSAVAGWSEADFLAALRTMKRPNGSAINPVMPAAVGQMNDVELKAIWSYLQTLPPMATGVKN